MEIVKKIAKFTTTFGGNPRSGHAQIWMKNRVKIILHLPHKMRMILTVKVALMDTLKAHFW